MPEVFNSGNGGYTCDCCSKLLWSGPSNVPRYTYAASSDSIIRHEEKYFCSEECVNKSIQLERKKNHVSNHTQTGNTDSTQRKEGVECITGETIVRT